MYKVNGAPSTGESSTEVVVFTWKQASGCKKLIRDICSKSCNYK